MSDYRVEADENLVLALGNPAGYRHLSTENLIALAQANATLALAEQQRISNLIAVANAEANIFSALSKGSPFVPVFDAIREGLNL